MLGGGVLWSAGVCAASLRGGWPGPVIVLPGLA